MRIMNDVVVIGSDIGSNIVILINICSHINYTFNKTHFNVPKSLSVVG